MFLAAYILTRIVPSGCLPEEWANAASWVDDTRPGPEGRLCQRPHPDGTE